MEIGAFFILIIVFAVFVVLGGIVFAIAAKHRREQLSPNAMESARKPRPPHHEVDNEQKADFVGTG